MLKLLLLALAAVALPAYSSPITPRSYDLIGCFEESNPGKILIADRHNINWEDIVSYMQSLAKKCSTKAAEEGFAGFALHYWGECYGRTAKQLQNINAGNHKEKKCVGDQTYVKCDHKNHQHCTGRSSAEAIYKFKISSEEENVNGGLGEWEQWTECDKECGNGFMHRERNCDAPLPKGKGKDCSELGKLTESKECKIRECPVNGRYSKWGSFEPCTKSCGGGMKTRERLCNNPAPAHGGENCEGASSETVPCNTGACPVNGRYSKWGSFEPCTKSCGGGMKTRERLCNNPAPAHGGENCAGASSETVPCNTGACPVNGGFSNYGAYGACNKVCGGGVKYRTRTCTNPKPAHGGKSCSGPTSQSASCNTHVCPDITGCSTKYTTWSSHGGGQMVYIDRHGIDCGGNGHVLTMFHLQRIGENIRYQYTCCSFRSASYCSNQRKYTDFSSDGNSNAVYLDRHGADCGTKSFINSARVERSSQRDKIRYNYECCNLASEWKASSSCYDSTTSYTFDGRGRIYYLDRQTVSCRAGYAISYYRLERNHGSGDKYRYRYRCCKVNF